MTGGVLDRDDLDDSARRILSELTSRPDLADPCKIGGGTHTPLDAPWRGADREGAKTRLFKYVRSTSEGVPLGKVVRDVFDLDDVDGSDPDYQLARRFFDRYDMFKTDCRGGVLFVEPGIEAFHLKQQYANGKKAGRRGGSTVNAKTGERTREDVTELPNVTAETTGVGSAGDDVDRDGRGDGPAARDRGDVEDRDGVADRPVWAKDRVRRHLETHVRTEADSLKRQFLDELATEREATDDRYNIFKRVRGTGRDFLLVPWTTRYNDEAKAGRIRRRFRQTLANARDRHRSGVCLTLTTDPKRYDSFTDALDGLMDAKGQLMSWLAYDPSTDDAPARPGYRPDNLTVLEFMQNGIPHVHVVLFGVEWATSQEALSNYWDDRQGEVVDIRPVRRRGDRWLLRDGDGDDNRDVSLRRYLGKAIRSLDTLAGLDVDELRDRVEAGDISALWRQALYWATGRQYWSATPDLTPDDDDGDDLPHVPVWSYVGAARYENLPARVRQNARIADGRRRGEPPPGPSGTTSTAGPAGAD